MSKQEDTLDKAYGNIPKEVGLVDVFDWVPPYRGLKYYWYKLVRRVVLGELAERSKAPAY